jgi:hypothetical protein
MFFVIFLCILTYQFLFHLRKRNFIQFTISKAYLSKTSEIEDFINLWNKDYFIPNGVYATCPRNMAYIQFNVGLKSLMLIDRHEFPFIFN